MIGINTNSLVRLITNDDPSQARLVARRLDSDDSFFVPLTVSLELEWVLRGAYGLSVDAIVRGYSSLLAIRNLCFESDAGLIKALEYYQQGFDLADALHLVSVQHCDLFLSFDKTFAKQATRLKLSPSVQLL